MRWMEIRFQNLRKQKNKQKTNKQTKKTRQACALFQISVDELYGWMDVLGLFFFFFFCIVLLHHLLQLFRRNNIVFWTMKPHLTFYLKEGWVDNDWVPIFGWIVPLMQGENYKLLDLSIILWTYPLSRDRVWHLNQPHFYEHLPTIIFSAERQNAN